VEKGGLRLFVSPEVLSEVQDVLNRPEIRTYFPDLSDEIVGAFLERLGRVAEHVRDVPNKFRYSRDQDDEVYINLAIAADAALIVSYDKDLLDLMKGHTTECKEFRQRFRPLRIVEPFELLKNIVPEDSE
jgi:putative PIN family toxin of toxin-antitoxin system